MNMLRKGVIQGYKLSINLRQCVRLHIKRDYWVTLHKSMGDWVYSSVKKVGLSTGVWCVPILGSATLTPRKDEKIWCIQYRTTSRSPHSLQNVTLNTLYDKALKEGAIALWNFFADLLLWHRTAAAADGHCNHRVREVYTQYWNG